MHWTLDPSKSVALALLAAVVGAVLAVLARPIPVLQIAIGLVAGVAIGVLQARSLQQAPSAFCAASTAMQVRRALTSTGSGKMALRIEWATGLVLMLVTMFSRTTPAGINAGLAFASGYLVLMAVRGLASLRGLRALTRAQERGPGGLAGTDR